MRSLRFSNFTTALSTFVVLVMTIALTGCLESGGSISSSGASASSSLTTWGTFQGLDAGHWVLDNNGTLLAISHRLSISGKCSRGTETIQVLIEGSDSGVSAPCIASNYSWAKTIPADGTFSISLVPLTGTGRTANENAITKSIVVDTTPPPNPVITTNSGHNFASVHPTVTINGTVSNDTYKMTTTDTTARLSFTANSGVWSLTTLVSDGQVRTVSVTAYDQAGNASGSTSITISTISSINLLTRSETNTVISTPRVGTSTTLVSGSSSSLTGQPPVVSQGGGLKLRLGFTNVVYK